MAIVHENLSVCLCISLSIYLSHFCVKACATLEEIDARQCDVDFVERQQFYDEDWV